MLVELKGHKNSCTLSQKQRVGTGRTQEGPALWSWSFLEIYNIIYTLNGSHCGSEAETEVGNGMHGQR